MVRRVQSLRSAGGKLTMLIRPSLKAIAELAALCSQSPCDSLVNKLQSDVD